MDDLFADFLAETRVELDRAQDALARLEQGAPGQEALSEIKRGVEAIRSRCAAIGFVRIAALGEGALAQIARIHGAPAVSPTEARTLRRAVDRMARLIATLAATGAELSGFDLEAPEPANDAAEIEPARARPNAWAGVEAAFAAAASQMGKHASMIIEPSAHDLPQPLVAAASAALERIVRFLCVYSIEPELVRRARGKVGAGAVRIAALTVGSEAVLSISDDGAGLNLERLRARAAGLKLIDANDTLTEADLAALIFAPNLSTLSERDNEAGLDRAKAMAEALGGSLAASSVAGRGTTFLLRLPLQTLEGAA